MEDIITKEEVKKITMSKKLTKKEKLTAILIIGSGRLLKLFDKRKIKV